MGLGSPEALAVSTIHHTHMHKRDAGTEAAFEYSALGYGVLGVPAIPRDFVV